MSLRIDVVFDVNSVENQAPVAKDFLVVQGIEQTDAVSRYIYGSCIVLGFEGECEIVCSPLVVE